LRRTPTNRNFTSVFADRTSFRAKGFAGQYGNRTFTAVFGDRTSFCAKGLRPEARNRNFISVFGDRTSFRAKGLRFVPSLPRAFKREIEKKKRAREKEGKRARGQDVRM